MFGFLAGHITDYFDPVLMDDGREVRTRGYITTVVTDAALDWMAADTGQPTLTYVAYNTPHSPFEVPDADLAPYRGTDLPPVTQAIYAMVSQLDGQFGRLLEAVDEDAVVIFLGDNGPARPGGVLRYADGLSGTKGSVMFGGTLVPALVRWPGVTQPGSRIDAPAQHIDILPTLMSALGGVIDPRVDGVDIRPLLGGQAMDERTFFTHHTRTPQPDNPDLAPVQLSPGAARRGQFSAVLSPEGEWALYANREQSRDVSAENPEAFAALKAAYEEWFAEVSPGSDRVQPSVAAGAPLRLPAHNAYLSGGAAYSEGWGWSQEWAEVDGAGAMRWPLRGDGGAYRIELLYGGAGTLKVAGGEFDLPAAQAPNRFPGAGHRRVVSSGEAITRDWARHTVGPVVLPDGDGDLRLELAGDLAVKGVRLIPAE